MLRPAVAVAAVVALLVSCHAAADTNAADSGATAAALEEAGRAEGAAAAAGSHRHQFIGAAAAWMGNKGGGTASEKEGCFACEFTVRKAYEMLKKSGMRPSSMTGDDFAVALAAACKGVPTVFQQAVRGTPEIQAGTPLTADAHAPATAPSLLPTSRSAPAWRSSE